ncbi:hypothetical protein ABW20_dc0104766 [Dactylellina cionopaga]|nr:hypothetical protein ABW20_dc0104766 [Dactylellina cionopaga]
MSLNRWIDGLPKCELHVHLEGTLTPDLVKKFGKRNGIDPLPDVFADPGQTRYKPFTNLLEFLDIYYKAMTVLITSTDFYDLMTAYLDKANSQNVMYAEIFFDPQAHLDRGLDLQTILSGLEPAIFRSPHKKLLPRLIMCIVRDRALKEANDMLDSLIKCPPLLKYPVVGIGLDSYEKCGPPLEFKSLFARAKKMNYHTTMHCDIDMDNSIEHIRNCLHDIGVDRLDHATNIVEDDSLIQEIVRKNIGITCCPKSNSYVVKDFKKKEIMKLLSRGVLLTINSDDPGFMDAWVSENLKKMANEAGMTKDQLFQVQMNAIQISWATDNQKDNMRRTLAKYITKGEFQSGKHELVSKL